MASQIGIAPTLSLSTPVTLAMCGGWTSARSCLASRPTVLLSQYMVAYDMKKSCKGRSAD